LKIELLGHTDGIVYSNLCYIFKGFEKLLERDVTTFDIENVEIGIICKDWASVEVS